MATLTIVYSQGHVRRFRNSRDALATLTLAPVSYAMRLGHQSGPRAGRSEPRGPGKLERTGADASAGGSRLSCRNLCGLGASFGLHARDASNRGASRLDPTRAKTKKFALEFTCCLTAPSLAIAPAPRSASFTRHDDYSRYLPSRSTIPTSRLVFVGPSAVSPRRYLGLSRQRSEVLLSKRTRVSRERPRMRWDMRGASGALRDKSKWEPKALVGEWDVR
jgi:hypothetical protein